MKDYKDYKPRKRVSKKKAGKRLPPWLFKAGLIIAAVVSILVAVKYSYRGLLKTTYFGLKEIAVAGEKRVKREEIVRLAGIKIGENILAMDLKAIGERVKAQPWIERATVRRVLPRGLSIEVQEREPYAILKAGKLYYLDREGKPFKELDAGDAGKYPLIAGLSKDEVENDELARDSVMKSFEFIETEAGDWPEELPISEISVNGSQGITAVSGNIEIKIGFGEYKIKVGRLKRVMEDLKAKGRTVRYIDLTYTGQVVVR